MTIGIVNVSSRGQIVIPKKIRKHLNIKDGSKLIVIEKNGSLILKKENDILNKLDDMDKRGESGWLALAEQSLSSIWSNKKDEKRWSRYLDD